jgi:hypothetical protein
LKVAALGELLRKPQRYVQLGAADSSLAASAMVGFFKSDESPSRHLVIARATVIRSPGTQSVFDRVLLEAMELPSEDDVDSVTLTAITLEQLASHATDVVREFDWSPGTRPGRGLWCGTPNPPTQAARDIADLGCVAGVRFDLAQRLKANTAFGQQRDVLVQWVRGMTPTEVSIAAEFADRGQLVLTSEADSFENALYDARVQLHELARVDHTARTSGRISGPPTGDDTSVTEAESRDTVHMEDRVEARDVDKEGMYAALGNRATRARYATGDQPVPGSPVRIGMQMPQPGRPDARDVLLAVTPAGERLHIIVTTPGGRPMRVISVWKPDDAENSDLWRPDRLGPTRAGERAMPDTSWAFPAQH